MIAIGGVAGLAGCIGSNSSNNNSGGSSQQTQVERSVGGDYIVGDQTGVTTLNTPNYKRPMQDTQPRIIFMIRIS